MMTNYKFCFHVLLIALAVRTGAGQDLIITTETDSINCKITDVDPQYIYFSFKREDGHIMNTIMNRNDVKYFQYNRFSQSTLPKLSLPGENYPKFTLGLWGGWSYRTAKVPSNIARELQDYITKLKSGTNYGLGIAYYFDAKWGFGFLYSRFKSENRMENVGIEIPDEGILVGTMADNIKIHYYAPVLFYRNYSPNAKAVVYSSFSMGYLEYTNNAIMIFDATLRGATLGYGLSLGIDVLVSKQVALGAEVLLIGGNLQQYTIEMMGQKETIKLDKENYENLSRIEFCLGLKLYLD